MSQEDAYVDPKFCISCAGKHSRDLEHHLEDAITGSKDNPELRQEAQQMVDQVREIRRKIDEIRIDQLAEEKAKKKLQDI